jgi:hypothetical protein
MWRHRACCLPRLAVGPSSKPSLNEQLHYPADLDRPLNEAAQRLLTKLSDTVPTIIIVPLMLFPLCLLLLVRLDASTVSLCSFYFCRLIGKLTAFLQLQEFSLRNPPFTTVARGSPRSSSLKLVTFSPRLQLYVSL